jgi:hypothetical protein
MRAYLFVYIISFFLFSSIVSGQKVDPVSFFQEQETVGLQLWGDLKNIDQPKQYGIKRPGFACMVLPDSIEYKSAIEFTSRGKSRFELCDPPPLMLYFKNKNKNKGPLSKLGKLKMVWACESGDYYNKLVLREYLVYKMYNLITPYSFRVRLLNVVFNDSSRNGSSIKRIGFLMEDIDDVAARLHSHEYQDTVINARETNQQLYALMVMFQYMIGNTDWAIINYQNIKLIVADSAQIIQPVTIPYDFDNCGLVNATYAVPPETMPIDNVAERYNKGISLSIENIRMAADIFKKAEPELLHLIENTKSLSSSDRRYLTNYLYSFFNEMKNFERFSKVFLKDNKSSKP